MRGVDLLTLPFISSIDLMELPVGVESEVWAKTSGQSGRIKGVMTIDPKAYRLAPTEGMDNGLFWSRSMGHGHLISQIMKPPQTGQLGVRPVIKTRGAPARLVVAGQRTWWQTTLV